MIQLQDKKNCVGCFACSQRCPSSCISMEEDSEGFLYPSIDTERCTDCGICEKVCPVVNQQKKRDPLKVFAAKNKNEEIRSQSSSGGVFTLLAEHILDEGGVVFGARFNKKWEVVHDYTETTDGLAAFRGSKYAQSRIGNMYKQAEKFLKEKRKVLFTGTPCQIAGLKLYLGKEYEDLLTVEFICHGVPSPKVWQMYLDEICIHQVAKNNSVFLRHKKEKKYKIERIEFRGKKTGWKKSSFAITFSELISGKKNSVLLSETLNENLFMQGFLKNLYLRPSCHSCPSKSLKSGCDITIGDFWGIQNCHTDFDDDKGVSLVMINTPKGNNIWYTLDVSFITSSLKDALACNSSILYSAKQNRGRDVFFSLMYSKSIHRLILRTCFTKKGRFKRRLKSLSPFHFIKRSQ